MTSSSLGRGSVNQRPDTGVRDECLGPLLFVRASLLRATILRRRHTGCLWQAPRVGSGHTSSLTAPSTRSPPRPRLPAQSDEVVLRPRTLMPSHVKTSASTFKSNCPMLLPSREPLIRTVCLGSLLLTCQFIHAGDARRPRDLEPT